MAFNNGRGYFSVGSIKLPTVDGWGVIPEVSAWDIDNDGDMDIVISRAGFLYAGVAIQVLENLGNKKFNSSLYELLVAPEGFEAKSEGNPYNAYIQSIRFADAVHTVSPSYKEDVMLPFLGEFTIPIIPLPPRLVTL